MYSNTNENNAKSTYLSSFLTLCCKTNKKAVNDYVNFYHKNKDLHMI